MVTNQGNPGVENSGNLGPDTMVVEVLKQLVQENQALSAKVEAMEVQVNEMKKILLTLGNGGTNANATTVNTEPQVICPSPLAEPGISPHMCLPGINCQNHQAAQALNPAIIPQKPPLGLIPPSTITPQVQDFNPENLPQALHFPTRARKSHKTPKYRQFDPVPMPHSDLFNHLLSNDLITTRSMKPLQPPFPRSYSAHATCEFHKGGVGHTLEDCKAFKHTVQDLIESGWLSFDDGGISSLQIKKSEEASQGKSFQYDSIPMSYADLCSYLIRHNVISPCSMKPTQAPFPKGYNPKAVCEFHAGAIGHSIEDCEAFKYVVRDLVNAKRLIFKEDGKELMINLDPQNSVVIRLRVAAVGKD